MGTVPSPLRQSPHLRLHCVNVFVRDQDRSLRFFVDQLGFNVAFDTRVQSGERWVGVAPPDGAAILSLIVPKPNSEQHKLIGRATQVVFVTEDVTSKFLEWSKRGVRFQSTPRLKRIRYQSQPAQTAAAAAAAGPSAESSSSTRTGMLLGEETPIWGGIVARFRDIDGNSFSLVSFDELTHAMEAQRRTIVAKQEAERRAAHELEIAKHVQSRLFPQTLPPLATLEYSGVCIQARQVGGDYYDFLDLGQNRLAFVIADISGKGIAAALLMASLQANLRSLCAIAKQQPDHLLCSVNQLFCENTTDGAFATLFFAEYDDSSRLLRYANCGHLPALLLRNDGSVTHLDATAMGVRARRMPDRTRRLSRPLHRRHHRILQPRWRGIRRAAPSRLPPPPSHALPASRARLYGRRSPPLQPPRPARRHHPDPRQMPPLETRLSPFVLLRWKIFPLQQNPQQPLRTQ